MSRSVVENEIVLELFHRDKCTALELVKALKNDINISCPDDLVRKLNLMRKKGLIHGEYSEERSAWVFWAEKPPEDEK
jgi:hypothetical protein